MLVLVLSYVKSRAIFIKLKRLLKFKNLHFICKHNFLLRCVLKHNFNRHYPRILIDKTSLLKFILIFPYLSHRNSGKRSLHDPLIEKLMKLLFVMFSLLKYEKPKISSLRRSPFELFKVLIDGIFKVLWTDVSRDHSEDGTSLCI